MNIYLYPEREQWASLLARPVFSNTTLDEVVNKVIRDVSMQGDQAVLKYTLEFDKVSIDGLKVSEEEIRLSEENLSPALKEAMKIAAANITLFHKQQLQPVNKIETQPGVLCWQKSVPIERVGLYVPGGTAPLFSTVLMLGIPAKIAGCKEIVLCTPPSKDGKIHPAILYAASIVGIQKIFKIGGIQSIAAMALGTESVPKVYKIFGPGNQYVTAAKQILSRDTVAIDMPAGPSEVAVMIDETAVPEFVAADLLSQAEHGKDSQVILFATDRMLVDKVMKEVDSQLEHLSRKELAIESLKNSKAFVLNNIEDMIDMVNDYAPEHLIISMKNYSSVAENIINAGSVFLGNYTPESAGDYASGTNHTLPTNGFAKSFNGVNMDSYMKKITYQELSHEGLISLGPVIETMANAELLTAHANATTLRMNKLKNL